MTNTKKGTFQLSIKMFCVLGCFIQKTFWQLGPKKTSPKHSKNWGFSNPPPQKKKLMITKRPVLDKNQNQKFQLFLFFLNNMPPETWEMNYHLILSCSPIYSKVEVSIVQKKCCIGNSSLEM